MEIKTEWNLEPLAGDFGSSREEIKRAFFEFRDKWKDRTDYLEDVDVLKEALDNFEALKSEYANGDEGYYFWLKMQLDESNPSLRASNNRIDSFEKEMATEILFFKIALGKISIEKQGEFLKSEILSDYRHFLEKIFERSKYILSEKEEKILSLKSNSAYSSWVDMVSGFLSKEEAVVIDENHKEVTKSFSEIASLLDSPDAKVREIASKKFDEILSRYEDVAENELNAVLENKKVDDLLKGYERPDKSRHVSDDIGEEVVDALVKVVSERFDLPQRFYNLKAKLLGMNKFSYSERRIEYGKLGRSFNFENSALLVKKVFSDLDEKFLEILEKYFKDGKIDVFPRKGKRAGAFCVHLLKRQPVYVMLNHTDKLKDVLTLAHEMGHAIHFEFMKEKNNSLNIDTPKSTAEVASTFMEDFVFDELLREADNEERLILIMRKLQDDVQKIFRQIACYKFEQELHKEFREKGYLSKEEIGILFVKHMKDYLGDVFEEGKDMERGWIYWSHIRDYFYNYSYASGLLISKSLQKMVREDGKNIDKVKEFFYGGTSLSPKEIFSKMNIDISDKSFWNEGLKEIEELLFEAESLAKDLGKI